MLCGSALDSAALPRCAPLALHPRAPSSPLHGCSSSCRTSPLTLQRLHFYSLLMHIYLGRQKEPGAAIDLFFPS